MTSFDGLPGILDEHKHYHTKTLDSGVVVLTFHSENDYVGIVGFNDSEQINELAGIIDVNIDRKIYNFLLTMKHIVSSDSVRMQGLVSSYYQAKNSGGSFKLCEINPGLRYLMQKIDMDHFFDQYRTINEALDSFGEVINNKD